MRPEEKIEKRFVKKIEELGYKALKFEVHGMKGAPDRIILGPEGQICFIEFKQPGGRVSHHQTHFIRMLLALGHRASIQDNWKEALEWVQK